MPTDPMDLDALRDTLASWLQARRGVVQEELAATIQMSLERLEPDAALLASLAAALPERGTATVEGEASLGSALDAMGGATSQAECLQRMLDGLALLTPRSAVFIVKQGILNLYAWRGFDAENPKGGTPVVPPPELLDMVMGHGASFDGPGPAYQSLLVALSPIRASAAQVLALRLKRRTVAVVLVDSGTSSGLSHPNLVRALVQCGAAALGNLGAPAPEDRVSVTQQVPEMPPSRPAPSIPAPSIPNPSMPGASAPTIQFQLPVPPPPPPPEIAEPIPFPPPAFPTIPASPLEITNPGLSIGLDPKLRSAAERLARVLAGDIELYFPAKVAQARTTGNLYGLLQHELERSRQTFLDRFGAAVETDFQIFQETVVMLLCDGDPKKLGVTPWK